MKLTNIRKIYHNKRNDKEALKGINLELNDNGLIVLLGSSGCGKTTLLNIISGKDQDFEGTLTDLGEIDYLTQEFNLLESMSVLNNLLMVQNDPELVNELLKKFDLWEHRNKKVKKISNGQKKRVQFIRALLHKPGMLLCDEPTAALDHDNSVLIMKALKEVSKDIQVIVVTHDIALAEKYADRIIRMDKGIIVSDRVQSTQKYNQVSAGTTIPKKNHHEIFWLIRHELLSRKAETSLWICLSALAMLATFVTFNLYTTIESQTEYKNAFKYAENLIVSYPKDDTVYIDQVHSDGAKSQHVNFDIYEYKDIQDFIEGHPEIIAVEAFYDSSIYYYGQDTKYWISEGSKKAFQTFELSNMLLSDKPMSSVYYMTSKELESLEAGEKKYKETGDMSILLDIDVGEFNHLNVFNLVSNTKLPIIYGEYPSQPNEVLLPVDTADLIIDQGGYLDYEDLIGETIYLGNRSRWNGAFYYVQELGDLYQAENRFEVVIKGITPVENRYMDMIFFNTPLSEDVVMNYYVKDIDSLYYEYVRFLVEPGTDYEAFTQEVNNFIVPNKSIFSVFSGRGLNNNVPYYRNIANFMKYSSLITVIFLSLILLVYLFVRKRKVKENHIIETYGYDLHLERLGRIISTDAAAFMIVILVSGLFCNFINEIAVIFKYEKFMQFDLLGIFVSALLIVLFELLCEKMMEVKKYARNKKRV